MNYWVYENWRAESKAVIHKENCPSCNFGKGVHYGASEKNGKWRGRFSTYNQAYQDALLTERKIYQCKRCNPVSL